MKRFLIGMFVGMAMAAATYAGQTVKRSASTQQPPAEMPLGAGTDGRLHMIQLDANGYVLATCKSFLEDR